MSKQKERFQTLKNRKNIHSDSDVLRLIYRDLKSENRIVKNLSEDDFVKNRKGSFSQMIDGKRDLDLNYYLPLERIFDTSMTYLLDGKGEMPKGFEPQGFYYASCVDSVREYEKIVKLSAELEFDEFGFTLLEYMIENKSTNGLTYFAERNELPLNGMAQECSGMHFGVSSYGVNDLIKAIVECCPPSVIEKYFDGFYYLKDGRNPADINDTDFANFIADVNNYLFRHNKLYEHFCRAKAFSLFELNQGINSVQDKLQGKGLFADLVLSSMVTFAVLGPIAGAEARIKTLDSAIKINQKVITDVLSHDFGEYRMDKHGYVYSGEVLVGGIALPCYGQIDFGDEVVLDKNNETVMKKVDELLAQIDDFKERMSQYGKVSVFGDEMYLSSTSNSNDFLDFYRMMNHEETSLVPFLNEEKSQDKYCLRLPYGKPLTLSSASDKKTLSSVFALLGKIDAISAECLGDTQTYAFPTLDLTSFYGLDGQATFLAPLDVTNGCRYDNLARLLSQCLLLTPLFQNPDNQIATVVEAIKDYLGDQDGIADALAGITSYYERSLAQLDRSSPDDIPAIAKMNLRILWLDLFADQIKTQFQKKLGEKQ